MLPLQVRPTPVVTPRLTSVLIVDTHPLSRLGMRTVLQQLYPKVEIREVSSYEALRQEMRTRPPSLVILDLSLPEVSGFQVIRELRHMAKDLPILAMSWECQPLMANRLMQAGISGYVSKQKTTEEFAEAVRCVARGARFNSEVGQSDVEMDLKDAANPLELLSEREFEVLRGLARGRTLTELSGEMFLSIKTVSTYRARLMRKLGVKNQVELILLAHSRR